MMIQLTDKYCAEESGIPRIWMLSDWGAALRIMRAGRKPWLMRHLVPNFSGHISGDDFDRMLIRSAMELRKNPELRGVFGVSWYYDPEVRHITPNISFAHDKTISCGGFVFPVETTARMFRDAIKTSKRRLHEHQYGSYRPRAFCAAIPRRKLLARY